MSRLVLVISIGPVQGFVRTARKARDLAASSRVLSRLTWAAAVELGTTRVVPGGLLDPDASYANKLIAVVEEQDLPGLPERSRRAALAELLRAASEASHGLPSVDHTLLRRELESFLEVTWAAAPWTDSFGAAREEAERALNARKRLRDFTPWLGVAGRAKSSSDGGLEDVLGAQDEHVRRRLRARLGEASLGANEYLDGPSLVRRFWQVQGWPSLAQVATAPFQAQAEHAAPQDWGRLLDAWENARSGALGIDLADALVTGKAALAKQIDDQLSAEGGEKPPTATIEARVASFAGALGRFCRATHSRPSPYLAIVVGDGDHVGRFLSRYREQREHEQAAEQLAHTAARMRALEGSHPGARVVFAGGDDLLALVPVDRAVAFADAARLVFATTSWPASAQGAPTFSVGLAIRHVRDSLQEGLALARVAETRAKEAGRDRLGVTVDRRGGAPWEAIFPWKDDPRAWLDAASSWLRSLDVPRGVAYELRQAAEHLAEVRQPEVVRGEVGRILSRKRRRDGQELDPRILARILAMLPDRARAEDIERMAMQFLIASHLATYSQSGT